MEPLTDKERCLLDYIKERMIDQIPPTVREICRDLEIKSTSSAHHYLKCLEQKGYIAMGDNANRVIRLVGGARGAQVPLVDAAAGHPIMAFENIKCYIPFPIASGCDARELFALRVQGDSMIDAAILDGDLVVVRQSSVVENGTIAAVVVEDAATIKRFYQENGHVRLQPENAGMEPVLMPDCRVLGRVIAVLRMLA
ncbi:MAG: transcriptional repressor LexA [Oscillospiraceae bacterium]